MAVPDSMRTSDAERDQVLDRLREALVEGRLDAEEFDERATATLAARTHGQLRVVTVDLPPKPSRPLVALAKPGAARSVGSAPGPFAALHHLMPWVLLPIFAVLIFGGSLIGRSAPFWPALILFWIVLSSRGRHRANRRRDAGRRRQLHDEHAVTDRRQH